MDLLPVGDHDQHEREVGDHDQHERECCIWLCGYVVGRQSKGKGSGTGESVEKGARCLFELLQARLVRKGRSVGVDDYDQVPLLELLQAATEGEVPEEPEKKEEPEKNEGEEPEKKEEPEQKEDVAGEEDRDDADGKDDKDGKGDGPDPDDGNGNNDKGPDSDDDFYTIVVKLMTGEACRLEVTSSDLIDYVKGQIQLKKRIAPKDQRLCFLGQQLEDGRILSEYNIGENATLYLQEDAEFSVRVDYSTAGGNTRMLLTLFVHGDDCVGHLMGQCEQHLWFPPGEPKLKFLLAHTDGHVNALLDDSRTLASYGIQSSARDTWLQIQDRHPHVMDSQRVSIIVLTPMGPIDLHVFPSDLIYYVKGQIQRKLALRPKQLRLLYGGTCCSGTLLEDGQSLEFYGIVQGATLRMTSEEAEYPVSIDGCRFYVNTSDRISHAKGQAQGKGMFTSRAHYVELFKDGLLLDELLTLGQCGVFEGAALTLAACQRWRVVKPRPRLSWPGAERRP